MTSLFTPGAVVVPWSGNINYTFVCSAGLLDLLAKKMAKDRGAKTLQTAADGR